MDVDGLLAGNRAFAQSGAHAGLTMAPRRRLLVIGCVDPRVDPERVLGLSLGDAAVLRNVGGRVVPGLLQQLRALATLGRPASTDAQPGTAGMDVLVLHHTDCGILRLAEDPDLLARALGVDPDELPSLHVRDPEAAVRRDAEVLRRATAGRGGRVGGLVYDVASGIVSVVDPPPGPTG